MNVLIVTVLAPHSPSGVVTYYNTLTQDLTNQGMNVSVINALDTPFFWKKFLGLLKRIMHPFGKASQAMFEEFSQFTGIYMAVRGKITQKPDLIHAQDAKSGVAARMALNTKTPIVMTCHFNDNPVSELVERFPMNSWFETRFTAWYTYLFSQIKSYVFVSDYACERSKFLLPGDAQKITIHNTVTINSTSNNGSLNGVGTLIISNVGYVDERKNQKLLILIGDELRKRGIGNFAIWLIGDGPKRQEYAQLANSLGLTDHVKFYGQQPEPWQLVSQSDLYVHTALNDNCPYSIIEALAVKTPVLALPVGGIPEMLPKHAGLLTGTDVETLTDQVEAYFNLEKRMQLKQAQALHADDYFNHLKSLTKQINFYHQIEQAA